MAQGFIPAASSVGKAMRGWPSSPKAIKPGEANSEAFGPIEWLYGLSTPDFRKPTCIGLAGNLGDITDGTFGFTYTQTGNYEGKAYPSNGYVSRWKDIPSVFTIFIYARWYDTNGFVLSHAFGTAYDFGIYTHASGAMNCYYGANKNFNCGGTNITSGTTFYAALVVNGANATLYSKPVTSAIWNSGTATDYALSNSASAALGFSQRGPSGFENNAHTIHYAGAIRKALSLAEIEQLFAKPGLLTKPTNPAPIPLSPAQVASVTQGAVPASSPVVRAVRGFSGG